MVSTSLKLIIQGLKDMRRNAWAHFLAFGAVALVAFLAGLFLMLLTNLDSELSASRGEVAVQVYWKNDMDLAIMRAQWDELSHMPYLVSWSTYTPEQALEALTKRIGQSGDFDISFLKGNSPLPGTVVLNFQPHDQNQNEWLKQTETFLRGLPGVERVVANPLREELARVWKSVSRQVMIPSMCLLAGVLALVVGNTIRLIMLSRVAEVDILKLVGAENWYIRLPLLSGGFTLGFAGGLFGLILLSIVYWQLKGLYLPPLITNLKFLPPIQLAIVVIVPAIMGVIGSYVAIRK